MNFRTNLCLPALLSSALFLSLALPAYAGAPVDAQRSSSAPDWHLKSLDTTPQKNSLTRELSDELGSTFWVTITPPAGKAADPRIFDGLRLSSGNPDDAVVGSKAPQSPLPELDVTGYSIHLEKTTAASCTSKAYVYFNYSLGAGGYVRVTSTYPEHMSAVAYPESGDVNTYVYVGSSLCASSKNGTYTIDSAGCSRNDCNNTSSTWYGYIKNDTSSTAKMEGVITIVYVTL